MKVTLTVEELPGGYEIVIEDREERAVATTKRQAALRAKEMIEKALSEKE